MTKRNATGEVDDGQPRLISLDEKHQAHRLLREALAAGSWTRPSTSAGWAGSTRR